MQYSPGPDTCWIGGKLRVVACRHSACFADVCGSVTVGGLCIRRSRVKISCRDGCKVHVFCTTVSFDVDGVGAVVLAAYWFEWLAEA